MSEQVALDGAAFDATNLRALQADLRRLNAVARADGLFGDTAPAKPVPPGEAPAKPRKGARKRGKAAARRLLELAGRHQNDDSLDVPGTRFTEAGVVRLLARLRRRRDNDGAWPRFLGRVQKALSRPVPDGQHLVAGVGLARLQIAFRQIIEIETYGLAHLATRRAIRLGRVLQAGALKLGDEISASMAEPEKPDPSKREASKPKKPTPKLAELKSAKPRPSTFKPSKEGGSR